MNVRQKDDNGEYYEDDTILNCTVYQNSEQTTPPKRNSNTQDATLQLSQPLFQLQNICRPKVVDELHVMSTAILTLRKLLLVT